MPPPPSQILVLVRAGARLCGLPVNAVVETMRPLPVAPIAGAPPFVRGVAIARGEPVPVVDLAAVLGEDASSEPTRFVTVRAGARFAALAVSAVVGVGPVAPEAGRRMPLLSDACSGALESLRERDGDLFLVLAPARLVPPEAYGALEGWEADA